ncbi:SLAC1 anion channel family protein [Vibrio sp. WJH972]
MISQPSNLNHFVENKLVHFPISLFAIIMGLSGLTITWSVNSWSIAYPISLLLATSTSLIMLIFSAFYLFKIFKFKQAVLHELKHPIRMNFFPAFSISLLLISAIWKDYATLSLILWSVGTIVQFTLTLYVMTSWIHHSHYTISHVNPSWFIPVVGNIIVPISGVTLGFIELSWFFFSIGIVFWIILLTVLFYRLFFHDQLPPKLYPMLFILLAPPSIGFISYTHIIGGIDNFARILYYTAIFLSILLSINIIKFARLPFYLTSWAYSFPSAALATATVKMAHLINSDILAILGQLLTLGTTVLITWLVINTIKLAKTGGIFVSE